MIAWKSRLTAFFIHLVFSLLIAGMAALLVFFVWYPYPYREISGGRELFTILVVVDVVLGPILTLSIYNRNKSRQALAFDLSAIGLTQLVALGYGLFTVFDARPAHLVFEYDRFRVVHANEIPTQLLPKTPVGINAIPMTGPTMLSVRPVTAAERADVGLAELAGLPISARPDFWQSYASAGPQIMRLGKPVSDLQTRFPGHSALIADGIRKSGRAADKLRYLPLAGRKQFWTAFIDQDNQQVVAVIALDPY